MTAPETARSTWRARLSLGFEHEPAVARTVLARRSHEGPLVVQRCFHPDADGTCHAYVLHPPGGIAGGDELTLDVRVGQGARALITTPAATKVYRADGRGALQHQALRVAQGGVLQWLPQETIVFDGAELSLRTRIELDEGATAIAWEMTCLGRPACDERFTRGALRQSFELWRGQQPLVLERARIAGSDPALDQAYGLRGLPTFGTLLCSGGDDALVNALRQAVPAEGFACSRLQGAVVCRYLGARAEAMQDALRTALTVMRERVLGDAGSVPRIWLT